MEKDILKKINDLCKQEKWGEALDVYNKHFDPEKYASLSINEKKEVCSLDMKLIIKLSNLEILGHDEDIQKLLYECIEYNSKNFQLVLVGDQEERDIQLNKYYELAIFTLREHFFSKLNGIIDDIGSDRTGESPKRYNDYVQGFLKFYRYIMEVFTVVAISTNTSLDNLLVSIDETIVAAKNKVFARAKTIADEIYKYTTEFPYFYDYDNVCYLYLMAIYCVQVSFVHQKNYKVKISDEIKVERLKYGVSLKCDLLNAILVENGVKTSLLRSESERLKQYNDILNYVNEISRFESYYSLPNVSVEVYEENTSGGCYVATAVYGSYDCPEVWTLRRYRDDILSQTYYGRMFISIYYLISPTLVRWFGHMKFFKKIGRIILDHKVDNLISKGVQSTPYRDKIWNK